jgi:hypothetical protein
LDCAGRGARAARTDDHAGTLRGLIDTLPELERDLAALDEDLDTGMGERRRLRAVFEAGRIDRMAWLERDHTLGLRLAELEVKISAVKARIAVAKAKRWDSGIGM